jgi:hypothetical protein
MSRTRVEEEAAMAQAIGRRFVGLQALAGRRVGEGGHRSWNMAVLGRGTAPVKTKKAAADDTE